MVTTSISESMWSISNSIRWLKSCILTDNQTAAINLENVSGWEIKIKSHFELFEALALGYETKTNFGFQFHLSANWNEGREDIWKRKLLCGIINDNYHSIGNASIFRLYLRNCNMASHSTQILIKWMKYNFSYRQNPYEIKDGIKKQHTSKEKCT